MQIPHSQNSSFSFNSTCLSKCIQKYLNCRKKKQQKNSNESELSSIILKNKNLLKLDNSQILNQQSINSPFRITRDKNTKDTLSIPIKLPSSVQGKIRYKKNTSSGIIPIKKVEKPVKHFFHEFKDKLRCIFCGGKNCKHENYKNNLNNNNAIEGLNSNFITENIIASQRPSEILIQKYHLIQKFKILNINLIVNLQREGEHPYCGPNAYNLTSSGYSYNPSVFSGDDIKCKFSGWKDMEIPSSMNFMLDIVKDMSVVTHDEGGKVLVHCHAGYGRTGVVIVCYLLFNSIKDSDTIIQEVRQKRKKCVETKSQISYCKKFEDFLNHSRILFGEKESINVYLRRQEDLLYGNELCKYGFVPKIIIKVLNKIIELKDKFYYSKITLYKHIEGIIIDWNDELENVLVKMKNSINKGDWDSFDKNENLFVTVELLFDWFEDSVEFVISRERTEKIISCDLYCDFMFNIHERKKRNFSNKILLKQRKNLFDYIKGVYHCFEYEIIFSFSTFLIHLLPNNEEEKRLYDSMVDRISIGLLGFSYSDANNNEEYNKTIFFLYSGLSSIIKLICDSFSNNCEEETFSIVSPIRKNYPVKYNLTKKEKIPCTLTKDNFFINDINDRRKSYMIPRGIHTMLSNPRFSMNSSNFFTPITKNKSLIKDNENIYQFLKLPSKNLNEESEIPSFCLNTPSEVPSPDIDHKKNINLLSVKRDLGKVDEVISKNSNSINSSFVDKNLCNNSNFGLNNDSSAMFHFEYLKKIHENDKNKKMKRNKKTSKTIIMNQNDNKQLKNVINEQINHHSKMRNTMIIKKTNNFLSKIKEKKKEKQKGNNENEGIINLKKCMNI